MADVNKFLNPDGTETTWQEIIGEADELFVGVLMDGDDKTIVDPVDGNFFRVNPFNTSGTATVNEVEVTWTALTDVVVYNATSETWIAVDTANIDSALDENSTHAVQNKVITAAIDKLSSEKADRTVVIYDDMDAMIADRLVLPQIAGQEYKVGTAGAYEFYNYNGGTSGTDADYDIKGASAELIEAVATNTSDIATNAEAITGIKEKTDYFTVTEPIDLDTLKSDVAGNKEKADLITITEPIDLDNLAEDVEENANKIETKATVFETSYGENAKSGDLLLTEEITTSIDNTTTISEPISNYKYSIFIEYNVGIQYTTDGINYTSKAFSEIRCAGVKNDGSQFLFAGENGKWWLVDGDDLSTTDSGDTGSTDFGFVNFDEDNNIWQMFERSSNIIYYATATDSLSFSSFTVGISGFSGMASNLTGVTVLNNADVYYRATNGYSFTTITSPIQVGDYFYDLGYDKKNNVFIILAYSLTGGTKTVYYTSSTGESGSWTRTETTIANRLSGFVSFASGILAMSSYPVSLYMGADISSLSAIATYATLSDTTYKWHGTYSEELGIYTASNNYAFTPFVTAIINNTLAAKGIGELAKNSEVEANTTAIATKVTKVTTGDKVQLYGVNASNEQTMYDVETTLTDDDTKVPTSGAVVDGLAVKQDIIVNNIIYGKAYATQPAYATLEYVDDTYPTGNNGTVSTDILANTDTTAFSNYFVLPADTEYTLGTLLSADVRLNRTTGVADRESIVYVTLEKFMGDPTSETDRNNPALYTTLAITNEFNINIYGGYSFHATLSFNNDYDMLEDDIICFKVQIEHQNAVTVQVIISDTYRAFTTRPLVATGLSSDNIQNKSNINGATVTAALNSLNNCSIVTDTFIDRLLPNLLLCTYDYQGADGGEYTDVDRYVIQGRTYITLPTPTRTGYTFNGWYTASTGGSLIETTTTVTATTAYTIYAQWTVL